MSEKYLTVQKAATLMSIHPRTITRLLHAGKLSGAKVGRNWRIAESDVRNFYETSKTETAKIIENKLKGGGNNEE